MDELNWPLYIALVMLISVIFVGLNWNEENSDAE